MDTDFYTDKLTGELTQDEINSPTLAHPLSLAVQIALTDVLASWGVLPDGVVGHSGGETAAAYACGALTAKEAITVAYYRGIACENAPSGAMLAVRSAPDAKELQDALERNDVQIACFNGPQNLTLAGPTEGIQNIATDPGGTIDGSRHRARCSPGEIAAEVFDAGHRGAADFERRRRQADARVLGCPDQALGDPRSRLGDVGSD